MSITLILIILTVLSSIAAFNNEQLKKRMVFSPYTIKRMGEWHRFLTSGFLHANWMHLFFNMWVLFLFGGIAETKFKQNYHEAGPIVFALFYLLGIILSEVYSFFKQQDNPYYASLGASGAVSSILFASILFQPTSKIGLIFFPIGIPAYIFGVLYLLYSIYMARTANDNVGHYAHFYGALFGFIFPVMLKPSLLIDFIEQIKSQFLG